jgi:hypothetical protein
MIRIDEIYNNTFWPYIEQHIPLTRMFFCDPFGHTQPENLFNRGHDRQELNYIFMHDQEPVHLDVHAPLFSDVVNRNQDLNHGCGAHHQAVVVSERDSDQVLQLCSQYNWRPYYYFFHGWAALDWYRGYNRTFLIRPPAQRKITHSFISPNRIIGGRRPHRVELMYHLLKQGVNRAWISFPAVCPVEQVRPQHMLQYADANQVFESAALPWNFPNEQDHPMHSCWLSLFDECAESLAYVVTETVFYGRRHHLTEKTFKPIALGMPFVLASTAGSLEYLRSYGFQTFGQFWDESYDQELDDSVRLAKIAQLLGQLDRLTASEQQQLFEQMIPTIEHNYNHFYSGAFEAVLWSELTAMLDTMQQDFAA